MSTIYQASPPPWKNSGSQVEQWESGLVRVTQEYVVPRDQRESIAASNFARGSELVDINSPAADGLYIYPDPTMSDIGNGLSRISVTAYGRREGKYSVEMSYVQLGNGTTGITSSLYNGETTVNEIPGSYYVPQYKVQWVTIRGEFPTPDFLDELKFRDPIYTIGFNGEGILYPSGRAWSFDFSPSLNFGRFDERVLTMTSYPA